MKRLKRLLFLFPILFSASCYGFGTTDDITPTKEDDKTTPTAEVKKYTITWVVNGVSSTTTVDEGKMPEYSGTPTKESTNEYSYTFSGWEPSLVAATKDTTYTAKFTESKRKYKITFVVDGASTEKQFEYGETPSYGDNDPEKEGYDFVRWEPSIVSVTKDETYTAVFEEKPDETIAKYYCWSRNGVGTTIVYTLTNSVSKYNVKAFVSKNLKQGTQNIYTFSNAQDSIISNENTITVGSGNYASTFNRNSSGDVYGEFETTKYYAYKYNNEIWYTKTNTFQANAPVHTYVYDTQNRMLSFTEYTPYATSSGTDKTLQFSSNGGYVYLNRIASGESDAFLPIIDSYTS